MPTDLHPVPALRMSRTVCLLPLYAFLVCIGTTLPSCVIINNTIEWGILHSYAARLHSYDGVIFIAGLKLRITLVQLLIHSIYCVLWYCLCHFCSRSKVHSAANEAKKVLILIARGMSAPTASLYYVDQWLQVLLVSN